MMANVNTHHKWFKGVDSIRFVLALIVLLSHFSNPYVDVLTRSSQYFVRLTGQLLANAFNGTAAVIAFFIISGFVIHYPNKQGIQNLYTFWTKRFLRVLVPLIMVFFAGIKLGHPEKAVVWSLICELAYYAIYPYLAKLPLNWLKQFLVAYAMAALLIVVGARHDVHAFFTQSNQQYHSYYWQLGIFLTWLVGLPVWLLGVLLAEKIDQLQQTTLNKLFVQRMGILVLSCFFVIARSYLHLSYILSMNLFALLIYQWLKTEIIYYKQHQPNVFLEQLGKFSYSLYLCHPVIYLCLTWVMPNTLLTYPLLIISTVGVAYMFYILVEHPSHRLAVQLSKKMKLPEIKSPGINNIKA